MTTPFFLVVLHDAAKPLTPLWRITTMTHISTIIDTLDLDLNDDLAHEYELDRRNDEYFCTDENLCTDEHFCIEAEMDRRFEQDIENKYQQLLVTAEANSFIKVARLLSLPQLLNQHAILCCQLDEAGFSASDSIVIEVNAIVKEVRNG